MMSSSLVLVAILCLVSTCAGCKYEDFRGHWTFYVTQGGHNNTINCTKTDNGPVEYTYRVELIYPDIVNDEFGNTGFWTFVSSMGFEVVVHGRKFFAFGLPTSNCRETLGGFTHDVFGRDWACYHGIKDTPVTPTIHADNPKRLKFTREKDRLYEPDYDMINEINRRQSLWKAGYYREYETMTLSQMRNRAGGEASITHDIPKPAAANEEVKRLAAVLPKSFDWRDVHGVNYVSPIRDQDKCGACYAFASTAMNEARQRIATNNTVQSVFSPQDIVDCYPYTDSCDGGWAVVVDKYSENFGLVEESCNPYVGVESHTCNTDASCRRHYFSNYEYVGGYYGACNEEVMMLALVKNGPLTVAYKVYDDFNSYTGGIYRHTGVAGRFDPYEETNHAVLLVGYGIDDVTGTKFWIVKNSWGDFWGEKGYFRIVKGEDECAIESRAVQAFPVF